MRRVAALTSLAFVAILFTPISSTPAVATPILITCTDLKTQKTVVLRANRKSCKPLHATAIWRIQQSDSTARSGAGYANLRTCTSERTGFNYQFLKRKCAKQQNINDYWRTVAPLETPTVAITAHGYDSVIFSLAATKQNVDAPIAYYLITNIKTGQIDEVLPNNFEELRLSNLSPRTSYTFTIAAVSVDGTSPASIITPVITTGAVPPAPAPAPAPAAAPALAAPAFTISSASESKPVNSAITGYTITSTGGTIASYSISPAAPAGLTFSTSTGLLSGTPTSVASATAYTITATNASGSATRTFTLTVTNVVLSCANGGTCVVGDTGPGGGIIFYVAATPFTCGPTRSATCTYLEAAPSGWNTGSDPTLSWATNVNNNRTTTVPAPGALQTAIGTGYQNSDAIVAQTGNVAASSAAVAARAYGGNGLTDWYLPSKDELNQMCKWVRGQAWTSDETECDTSGGAVNTGIGAAGAGFTDGYYWSSSEGSADGAWIQDFDDGFQQNTDKDGDFSRVRPVRAF